MMPFQAALTVWKILNFILLFISTHLLARALADMTGQKYLMLFFGGIAFVSFMYAAAVTVWSGQSSILVYFGLAAFTFGLLKERAPIVIVGLIFLALKPQIGLLAFCCDVCSPPLSMDCYSRRNDMPSKRRCGSADRRFARIN